MTSTRLELSRDQILAHRRRVGALNERMPPGPDSLRHAARAGLQDSMPRAALFSTHARVAATQPDTWEDSSLVQLWGPRFSAYVVAAQDRAVFTLGRLPVAAGALRRAEETAARLADFLGERHMTYGEAGRGLGVNPNQLRYAAPTGTVLMRWDGARQPVIWIVPPPDADPADARVELARRYLHVFGPASAASFATWAGVRLRAAEGTFSALLPSLTPVRTPSGDAWILATDEAAFRADPAPPSEARLLPSGDSYYLLWGEARDLLVPDTARRDQLWTPRVWPGALLIAGEVAGIWRRSHHKVTVEKWRRLSRLERDAVEKEARSLPVPRDAREVVVRWES